MKLNSSANSYDWKDDLGSEAEFYNLYDLVNELNINKSVSESVK